MGHSNQPPARPGRPPKLSPSDKQYLKLSSLRERRKSCSTYASNMEKKTSPNRNFTDQAKKLLVSSGQGTEHPNVQTSTSLNVSEITWTVKSRKCNQLLRLNSADCHGKLKATVPAQNGSCNKSMSCYLLGNA